MRYSLIDLIMAEEKKAREQESEKLYWEAVFNSMFDMDSAGDRD